MSKKRSLHIFLYVFSLFLISALIFLSAPSQAMAKQEARETENYPYLSKVGSTENRTMLPSFLYRDEARKTAKTLMENAYKDMIDSGFDMGTLWTEQAAGSIREWSGYGVQEFRNGDHTANVWGRKHGYLVIGTIGEGILAGAVVNEIMVHWVNDTSSIGYPIGNRFKVQGDSVSFYQNFEKGFIKENNGNTSFTDGKHIDEQGVISDRLIVKIETGLINLKDAMPYWAEGKQNEISTAFKDAEQRIKLSGFNLGIAVKEVEVWRPENSVLSQTFLGGDNTGNPFGWGMQGRLMLNDGKGKAFALVGAQLTKWASDGGLGIVGYPLSDIFDHDGKKYQIFSSAYMLIETMPMYSEVVKISAGQLSLQDRYESKPSEGLTNVSANIFSVYRNYNNFIGNFGVPKDFVKVNGNVYYQEFFGGDNGAESGFIAQKGIYGSAHLVMGEAAKQFKNNLMELGAPMTDKFSVADKTYQNFEKGYVDFSGKVFKSGVKFSPILKTETALSDVDIHANTGVILGEANGYNSEAVKLEFISVAKGLLSAGFDIYEPKGKATIKNGHILQYFENTSSWANGRALIVKADSKSVAIPVYNASYTMFELHGSVTGEAEYARDFPFAFGKKVYQNFESSFIRYGEKGAAEFISGYNISLSGEYIVPGSGFPSDFVPDFVGKFGDINRIPIDYRDKQKEVQATFKKEYARLISLGFFPGNPDEELVHQWAPGSLKWLNQTFKNGDSQAEAFGNANAMKIFMMDLNTGACSIIDSMLTAWISYGSLNGAGYPIDNEIYYNGNLYQNFYGGYIVCPGGDPNAALFYSGEKFEVSASPVSAQKMQPFIVSLISIGCTLVVCSAVIVLLYFINKSRKNKMDGGKTI